MIHVGLPSPTIVRLCLRAQLAAAQTARRWQGTRRGFSERVSQLAHGLWPERVDARSAEIATAVAPAEPRETPLNEFAHRYDALVDLLCWSAQDGLHNGRDRRYAELRAWFVDHYDAVRPTLMRSMVADASDTEPLDGNGKAPRDAFESLFLPATVDPLLNSFAAIERIQRTRECLERCLADQDA